jgi:copper chaperone CopZ
MKNTLCFLAGSLIAAPILLAAAKTDVDEDYAPHTPTLTFHVPGLTPDAVASIVAAEQKLKSVSSVKVDPAHGLVQVRFDSHVVSYHQVAQAIRDAGASIGKPGEPALKFVVPDYAKGDNAKRVDAIFAGKKLNTRVKIEPIDKAKGEFLVHFLPLKVDPADSAPQGFNGGHIHHPISDPAPHGLALPSSYPTEAKIP